MTYWTKILSLALGLLLLTPASAQTKGKEEKKKDNKFSYVQAVDIFGSSLALLDRHFVDSIDIKRLSRIGLDGMLESLDPYTEYYSSEDTDKLRLLTTGAYGGIGSVISQRPIARSSSTTPWRVCPLHRPVCVLVTSSSRSTVRTSVSRPAIR